LGGARYAADRGGDYCDPHVRSIRAVTYLHLPSAIFFDLDDTLLDDRGAQQAYLEQVYTAWRDHLPHSAEEFPVKWRTALQHHFDRHIRGELSYVAQRRERIRDVFHAPLLSDDEADARMREFLDIYEASWRLFDDVLPVLDALSDRPLGVITNGTIEQQHAKLARMGIADRFALVLTSEAAGVGKPDPRIFNEAAARLRVSARDCVHVGDDWERDVEGSRRAGFRAVWLDRRHDHHSKALDADVLRIASLQELLACLV
jgi:putative hydrolase of the HAD superfamily